MASAVLPIRCCACRTRTATASVTRRATGLAAVWEPTVGDPLIELGLRRAHRGGGTMDYFGIVLGGTLDVFPDLQIVLGEAGIGWIPTYLQTMDFHHENELHTLGLEMK